MVRRKIDGPIGQIRSHRDVETSIPASNAFLFPDIQ